jgi:hypothetical protein
MNGKSGTTQLEGVPGVTGAIKPVLAKCDTVDTHLPTRDISTLSFDE